MEELNTNYNLIISQNIIYNSTNINNKIVKASSDE